MYMLTLFKLKKKEVFRRTHVLFGGGGALVPLFWISGDVSSGFQSQSWLPYSHCGGKRNVCSPRSISGTTLADLLSPHTVAEVRLPGFFNICYFKTFHKFDCLIQLSFK